MRAFHELLNKKSEIWSILVADGATGGVLGVLPLMLPHPDSAVLGEDTFNHEVIRLLDGGGGGKCLRCGRTFSLFNSARRHFKTVHLHGKLVGETPVKCDLCHKTFRNDMSYKYHLRNTHTIYQK